MRRLEAGEEDAVELVHLVLRQFSRGARVTRRQLLHVRHLRPPRQTLAEADADGRGQEGVEVGVEVGGDPEQVEEKAEHDGPLGGELVDEYGREETRGEHRQVHDAHRDDAEPVTRVQTRLDILDGAERGEDEDEAGGQDEQVASVRPAAAASLLVRVVGGVRAGPDGRCGRGGGTRSLRVSVRRVRVPPDRRDVIRRRDVINECRLRQLPEDAAVSGGAHFDDRRDGHVVRCSGGTGSGGGTGSEHVDVGELVLLVLVARRRLVAVLALRAHDALDEVRRRVLSGSLGLLRRVLVALVASSRQLRREQVARPARPVRRKVKADVAAEIPRRQRHRARQCASPTTDVFGFSIHVASSYVREATVRDGLPYVTGPVWRRQSAGGWHLSGRLSCVCDRRGQKMAIEYCVNAPAAERMNVDKRRLERALIYAQICPGWLWGGSDDPPSYPRRARPLTVTARRSLLAR